jgi:urease accessory protein
VSEALVPGEVIPAGGRPAVRRTGPDTAHPMATASGPLGGDDAEFPIVIEKRVRSAAAAVVLPARGESPPSRLGVHAEVVGALDLQPEPAVVTARAVHRAEPRALLSVAGELVTTEQVLLGNAGEEPGGWTGATGIERDGCPGLRTTVGLGPGVPSWLPRAAPRAYASTVLFARADPRPEVEVITGDDAVRLALPGGWVGAARGREPDDTVARLAALDGAVAALETAR